MMQMPKKTPGVSPWDVRQRRIRLRRKFGMNDNKYHNSSETPSVSSGSFIILPFGVYLVFNHVLLRISCFEFRILSFGALIQQLLYFAHKLAYVFKLPVDGSEPYIGHIVKLLEADHYHIADNCCGNFLLQLGLQFAFDIRNDRFHGVNADGSFFARFLYAVQYLEPVESLAPPVFLDNNRQELFNLFVGREPLGTFQTFTPSSDGLSVFAFPGIKDLVVLKTAKWTFHLFPFVAKDFVLFNSIT